MLWHTKRRRHSPYVSRLTTSHILIWESCAHKGTVPIKDVCSFTQVVIERLLSNMSLHSMLNADAKIANLSETRSAKIQFLMK